MLVKVLLILAIVSLAFCQFDKRFIERMRINPEARTPYWLSIIQPLDHFNPMSNETFVTRSLYNEQFSKPGGPIIVYIGGEWAIEYYGTMGGVAFQLAKEHSGFIFYPEHRFFGESFPTKFANRTSKEAFRYFTIEQALADIVHSLHYIKKRFEKIKDSQVVLVGGSYAGALAVWARLKYPDTISMAYACGGATRTILENREYYDIIIKSFEKQDVGCARLIKDGMAIASEMLKTSEGKSELIHLLQGWHCHHKAFGMDLPEFKDRLMGVFVSQLWYPNEWQDLCAYVKKNEGNGSVIKRFADVAVRTSSNLRENGACVEEATDGQWYWLLCTGLANFVITSPNNFGLVRELDKEIYKKCTASYGFPYDYVVQKSKEHGYLLGSHTPDTTKIVMTQGTHDPWYTSAIMDDINDQIRVIYIEGASHCADLGEEQPNETGKVVQSKIEVMNVLAEWLDT